MTAKEPLSGVTRTNWLAVIAIGLAVYMAALDMTIVATALPTIGNSMHASPSGTQWILLAYNLPMISLMIPLGRWVDSVGKRPALLLGIIGFAVSSAACGVTGDLAALIALRVVQGTFAALISALVLATASIVVASGSRGRAMGVIGVIGPLGSVSGPVLGSLIISHLNWSWLFFVNVPISAIAVGLVMATLNAPGRLSVPRSSWLLGAGLVGGAFVLLLLGITEVPRQDKAPAVILIVAGLVMLATWSRTSDAVDVLSVLRRRPLFMLDLALLLMSTAAGALYFLLPYLLEQRMHYSAGQVGSIMFVMPLSMGVVGIIGGHMSDVLGDWRAALVGVVLTAVGALLMFTQSEHWSANGTIARLVVVGVGLGLFVAPNQSAVMRFAPGRQMGTASSLSGLSRSFGFTLGPAISAVVIVTTTSANAPLSVPLATALGAVMCSLFVARQIRGARSDAPVPLGFTRAPSGDGVE